ncbi:MAG: S58 family peptidase [Acidobacteria bacterium]|nr:MAG: S58 family peptidase [Acidobacteriota bacterium]
MGRGLLPLTVLGLLFAPAIAVAAGDGEAGADKTRPRARELGLVIGVLTPGPLNAITDVTGVRVGHFTLQQGTRFNTGITAVLPHGGNLFHDKVPAAIVVGNGFGKLLGSTQVNELGELETPILLTGTLSVHKVADGLVTYMLSLPGMKEVRSINPVVGETNDGFLSDIRARPLGAAEVRRAIESAGDGPVAMGAVGAGTGTVCFDFKGGIGTASRRLDQDQGGWTVGVLVQTNFGGPLRISGLPPWIEDKPLGVYLEEQTRSLEESPNPDGSLMIVVATDAPLSHRNLRRLARRSLYGMARTGGYGSNGSGDYAIAFSTHEAWRIRRATDSPDKPRPVLDNAATSGLFLAAVEATEEAILDSLFAARTTEGFRGTVPALPVEKVLELAGSQTTLPTHP